MLFSFNIKIVKSIVGISPTMCLTFSIRFADVRNSQMYINIGGDPITDEQVRKILVQDPIHVFYLKGRVSKGFAERDVVPWFGSLG